MSEQLRHKMSSFEVEPPQAAWKAINNRLSDDGQYALLAKKMKDFESDVPISAWGTISERINDDDNYAALAAKLTNFDEVPPPAAWGNISTRLRDDEQYATLATKMNQFDATPPPQIMQTIFAALEESKKVSPAPVRMLKIVYRVAAAAVFAGVLIGGWMLMNRNTKDNGLAKNTNLNIPSQITAPVQPVIPGNNISTNKHSPDNQPVNASAEHPKHIRTINKTDGAESDLRYATVSLSPNHVKTASIKAPPILDKNGQLIKDIEVLTSPDYVYVTGPNGQSARTSVKFANLIRYFNSSDSTAENSSTEEYIDQVIKQSDHWKKLFREWRSKISQSSFIPSSVNFLDIAEFKELIKE